MALKSTVFGNRCGIVLAAGNGERLRDFVFQRRGDHLPKQYNNFIGRRSLLEHTFDRIQKPLPPSRIFTVVAREHLGFEEVQRQLCLRPPGTIVVQPENKDTAPGILLPLLHVQKRYPNAVVGIFPSDHFVLEENLFMRHVLRAFRIVEAEGSRIVLLGTEPCAAEPEYGYIVPGDSSGATPDRFAKTVQMFIEKPAPEAARKIVDAGALWNTLVFVARVKTLLATFQRRTPDLFRALQAVAAAIGTPQEASLTEQVYRGLAPLNFSKGVLEILPYDHRQNLLVLPVRGVTWNDWGSAARVLSTLQQLRQSNRARYADRVPKDANFIIPAHDVRPRTTPQS